MTLWRRSLSKDLFESLDPESATALLESRFQFLSDAGCTTEEAVVMAVHTEVEVEDALRLLSRGCPVRTALRILL